MHFEPLNFKITYVRPYCLLQLVRPYLILVIVGGAGHTAAGVSIAMRASSSMQPSSNALNILLALLALALRSAIPELRVRPPGSRPIRDLRCV